MVTPNNEPIIFSAGDSLVFNRQFSDFTPVDGWTLNYEIRQGTGGDAIKFTSASDPTNTFFQVNVPAATTAAWTPGQSVLVGYVLNTLVTSPDYQKRENVYWGDLKILPNFGTANDDQPTTTHAQRMVVYLEQQLEVLAQHILHETDVEQTRILRAKRLDLEEQLSINLQKRDNEIQRQSVRNGQPSGSKIVPQMNIVAGQPYIGNPSFNGIPLS